MNLLKTVSAAKEAIRETLTAPNWETIQKSLPQYKNEVKADLRGKVEKGEKLDLSEFPAGGLPWMVRTDEESLRVVVLDYWHRFAVLNDTIRSDINKEIDDLLVEPLGAPELRPVLQRELLQLQTEKSLLLNVLERYWLDGPAKPGRFSLDAKSEQINRIISGWIGRGASPKANIERASRDRNGEYLPGESPKDFYLALSGIESAIRLVGEQLKSTVPKATGEQTPETFQARLDVFKKQLATVDVLIEQLSPANSFEMRRDGSLTPTRRWEILLHGDPGNFGSGVIPSWRVIAERYTKPVLPSGWPLKTTDGVKAFLLACPGWEPGPHKPEGRTGAEPGEEGDGDEE